MFAWTPLILNDISPPHTLPLPDSRCPQLELGALLSLEKGIPRACTEPLPSSVPGSHSALLFI